MSVDGETTDSPYHLTQSIGDGVINGENFSAGINIADGAVVVNFKDREEKVVYSIDKIVKDAFQEVTE